MSAAEFRASASLDANVRRAQASPLSCQRAFLPGQPLSLPLWHSRHEKSGPPRPPNWFAFAGPLPQQLWSTNQRRTLPLDGR